MMFAGETGTVRVTVTNLAAKPATNVVATVTLPESFDILSTSPAAVQVGNVLTFTFPQFAASSEEQLDIEVRPTEGGTFESTSTVSSDNPEHDELDNSADLTIDVFDGRPCAVTSLMPYLVVGVVTSNNAIEIEALSLALSPTITFALVHTASPNLPLVITVTGTAISARLSTNGASAINTSANTLVTALNADSSFSALATAAHHFTSNGAGNMIALAATPLPGPVGGDLFDCYPDGPATGLFNVGTGFSAPWIAADTPFPVRGDNFDSYADGVPAAGALNNGSGFSGPWITG